MTSPQESLPEPPDTTPAKTAPEPFWPQGWWRLMELRIGVIPLPVLLVLLGIIGYFLHLGTVLHQEKLP
ncbi:MAG: malate permease, partial [Chthonomonadales bacterium]|nr:malate permease [Chthonomonadales bacterium]